ncbi:hypothetical protein CEE37_14465 [candidate division LCP-89 bacterium B3_LCP]|uniref:Solute-binding protein family 5 domain-containing protein n=1 Tax=candidate division LCP-89 bacterium B3_LCP TaxID=2012998 RepID=A0A532UPP7_UNCL8|nr:MAG: hypothetical protein CEE37_14465 [candidate division LCP-89 bacterium B3_LCP]
MNQEGNVRTTEPELLGRNREITSCCHHYPTPYRNAKVLKETAQLFTVLALILLLFRGSTTLAQELRIGHIQYIGTMDPITCINPVEVLFNGLMYPKLYQYSGLEIIGQRVLLVYKPGILSQVEFLAEKAGNLIPTDDVHNASLMKCQVAEGNNWITPSLDIFPILADDVIHTLGIIRNPRTYPNLMVLKNYIKDVRGCPDPLQLEIEFNRGATDFERMLNFGIVFSDQYKHGIRDRRRPLPQLPYSGTGFYYDIATEGGTNERVLTRLQEVAGGTGNIQQVKFRQYNNYEPLLDNFQLPLSHPQALDMILEIPPEKMNDFFGMEGYVFLDYAIDAFYYIGFNCNPKRNSSRVFAEVRELRKAMYRYTNIRLMLKEVYPSGNIVTGPFRNSDLAYNDNVIVSPDISAAEIMLDIGEAAPNELRYGTNSGKLEYLGVVQQFVLIVPAERLDMIRVASSFKGRMEQIGLIIHIETIPANQWYDRAYNKRNFDLIFDEFVYHQGYERVLKMFYFEEHDEGSNFLRYRNHLVNQQVNFLLNETDLINKRGILRTIHRLLNEDAAAIFLWNLPKSALIRSQRFETDNPFWRQLRDDPDPVYFFRDIKDLMIVP